MTPAEFTAALKRLGLTQAEFAAEIGAHANTVSAVATGRSVKTRLYELALRGLIAERQM